MALRDTKRLGDKQQEVKSTPANAWEVMKPFVRFGLKTTGLMAHVLIAIAKNIPRPGSHRAAKQQNDKVIKI